MFKGVLYEYNGEMLSARTIAGRVSLAPSTLYKYLKKGYSIEESIELGKKQSSITFQGRNKTNNKNAKTYLYKGNTEMTVEEICELEGITSAPLYRRLKKGMTPEHAVIDIKNNIVNKFPYLGGYYSKRQLQNMTGVTKWHLDRYIMEDQEYTEDEIIAIIDSYKQQHICMYEGMSLYQYCVKMKYNYNVIYYSMKTYGMTPEEAINQYLKCGQSQCFAYKYALGNILLYHFLIKMNIDDRYVMWRIREGRTEEEALVDAVFLNNEPYKTLKVRNRLRAIYDEIQTLDDVRIIKDIYHLDDDDAKFLTSKIYRAEEVLVQHKLFSVIASTNALGNTAELQMLLNSLGLSLNDLSEIREELLDGFVENTERGHSNQIKYVWRKEN